MISICIPIYNFDVRPLVRELTKQIQFIYNHEIEIILIDDASKEEFRLKNQTFNHLHEYIQLEENIGRAKIRNLFLQYTSQPYLLFLDCDGSVKLNPQFLQNYINVILQHKPMVCYGGRIYPEVCPSPNQSLSWNYGRKIESKPFNVRAIHPNRSFQTNNFIIHRSVFQTIQFDESLKKYGHEDTLFGIELAKNHIKILHIENPILNKHIESNSTYLEKNREAISNLLELEKSQKLKDSDFSYIRLLKWYKIFDAMHFTLIYYYIFNRFEYSILRNLESENPNLTLFNLYKLYIYIQQKKPS